MGTWGYKPFQNDDALDYYGGFHDLDEMKQLIRDGLSGKHKYCCAPYEIAGIVLESLGVYDLGHKDKVNTVLDCIKARNLSDSVRNELHESLELLLSVSALSIDSRKKVLQESIKGIQKYKDFDPYEYKQEVMNVINIAKEALNSTLQNAIVISEQDLNWLIDAYENSKRQDVIKSTREKYPNGVILFRLYNNDYDRFDEIGFCPGNTGIVLDESSDRYKERGISLDDVNIKLCNNIDEFMNKYFSKGFKIIKNSEKIGNSRQAFYTVYSNDYNKNMYMDTIYCAEENRERFYIPLEGTEKSLMKLFKKYAKESSTKTEHQTTGNRALDKFYDKHGKIIGYRITDGKKVMDVYSDQIKQAIAQGKIKFDNLTLTKDGRLYMTEKK